MIKNTSYRSILQTTSIIGFSSVVNIISGLVKMKFAAIILGPSGIGLIGIVQTFINTFVSIISLGVPQASIRALAVSKSNNESKLPSIKLAIFMLCIIMGFLSIVLTLIFKSYILNIFLKNNYIDESIILLGVGVSLSLFSSFQGALLNGLGNIKILSKITIISSLSSLILSIIILKIWGNNGLLLFVLIGPLLSFIIATHFIKKLELLSFKNICLVELKINMKMLLKQGSSLMIIATSWSIAHLLIRISIQEELGISQLGFFQASWTIGTFYLSFILNSLGTDFYPKLSAMLSDHEKTVKYINNQSEITILITAPFLILSLSLASSILQIFYSEEFIVGLELLRWQILSDVLKVITWPLSYYILASGNRRLYLFTELLSISSFLLFSILLIPYFGIKAVGLSSTILFIIILPINYIIAVKTINFKWDDKVIFYAITLIGFFLLIFCMDSYSKSFAMYTGITLFILFAIYSFKRLLFLYRLKSN